MTVNISRLFNKPAAADSVIIGGKVVAVPKLTIEKWKALFSVIDSLPQLIVSVLAKRDSSDFVTTTVVAAGLALDEAVKIVAVLADLEPEWVEKNASLDELLEFIRLTAEKNDLQRVAKNFRAVLGRFATAPTDGNSGNNDE
ncbi:hypothetical protein PACILC2_22850 [Paenibacillus cisolokensis]|uniref:Tail assembly chaperone n=1 Tax=Paenibacillus cisolokensis TaxID=1658519 RepID=A0ABQ4N6E2_9BACL|nr:hypothetical protein [Paenibacillus cisolokensis]GIQ63717.1 hypothetical protein PACILC2_22850 [Paenibacillus cisolokensis]